MNKEKKSFQSPWPILLGMLVVVFFILPNNAYAYLDPGTGSMILQTVLAIFLGTAFIVRIQWKKFKSLFKKNKEQQDKQDEKNDNAS
ncbi:MAG: hypothetical protein V2A56_03075 [bacterium]